MIIQFFNSIYHAIELIKIHDLYVEPILLKDVYFIIKYIIYNIYDLICKNK
jgi:hypothetical protein